MSYIQITTRCNMKCLHCCYSCTSKGQDMSPEVFRAALKIDDCIAIGGGEPTIHPNFWEFMGLAISECEYIWIATNGKETKTAIALAKMAKSGVIGAALSIDEWHDRIDPAVFKAFDRRKPIQDNYDRYSDSHDIREIRTVTKISKAGRAIKNGIWTEDYCPCEDIFIKPDGKILHCGCRNAPQIGHVFETFSREDVAKDKYDDITCYKKIAKKTKKTADVGI